MVKSKVSVGLSTVVGLLTAAAGFSAAVAAYKQGDRSEATLGTIAGGAVGAISLVTTMAGRFAQAVKPRHAGFDDETANEIADQIELMIGVAVDKRLDGAKDVEPVYEQKIASDGYEPGQPDIGAINARGEAVYFDRADIPKPSEPDSLTAEEAYEDPGMGDPLDAPPESFQADVRDKKGGGDAV